MNFCCTKLLFVIMLCSYIQHIVLSIYYDDRQQSARWSLLSNKGIYVFLKTKRALQQIKFQEASIFNKSLKRKIRRKPPKPY